MRRGTGVIVLAAVIATASYGIRALSSSDPGPGPARAVEPLAALGPGGGGAGFGGAYGRSREMEIERLVEFYEGQARRQTSTLDLTFLAQLYMQRGRLTGDLATYGQAEQSLERALAISPDDAGALALLAQARFTSHDFTSALRLSEDRLDIDPEDLGALAIAGDARLELGDHAGAAEAYGLLTDRLPDAAPVLVRQARLASLDGDAVRASSLAAAAESSASTAGFAGTDLAWYRSYRGQLELDSGHYGAAVALYRSAVRLAPRYYLPQAGLGRALAAAGRLGESIRQYERAVELLPDPTSVAALGDLYSLVGREEDAASQFATVEAIAKLTTFNKQVYNRAFATFLANHGLRPQLAVRLAEAELGVRKDVYGWDTYAWALYAAGRYAEARDAADEALRLGTLDARLFYHSGMISAALGDNDRAERDLRAALEISPHFDPVQAPIAQRALAGLASA